MSVLYRHTSLQPPDCSVHTFPSWRPQRAIDHVLITNSLATSNMRALPAALSDHLALSVDLDVPEEALRTAG
jgi:endonuclease/exonuclease/phosphatase family metal-dependent hydrolase